MLDMPILKFEKSTKYLKNQLEIQRNNKQLVLDIITNIGLIIKDDSDKHKDELESVLDSANLFLQNITSNITMIEQLDIEIKNITNDLSDLISDKGRLSKTKEFYIAAFTNIKQTIVVYSKKIRQLEDRLTTDNNNFNDFITENNIKFNYEKVSDSESSSDVYKFTGFSLNDETNEQVKSINETLENIDNVEIDDAEIDNIEEGNSLNDREEENILSEINVDDLSNDILAQANIEEIVNDYEEEKNNEKIDKLTNEFRNLLVNANNSDSDTKNSVISLFKEVLPEDDSIKITENDKQESEDIYNMSDLINDVIEESFTYKKELEENTNCNGFDIGSILAEFTLAKTENENHKVETLYEEVAEDTGIEEIELEQLNDVDDIDSLLSLLNEKDLEELSSNTEEITVEENIDSSVDFTTENNIQTIDTDENESFIPTITEKDENTNFQFENENIIENDNDSENIVENDVDSTDIIENDVETKDEEDVQAIVIDEQENIEEEIVEKVEENSTDSDVISTSSNHFSYSDLFNSLYPNSSKNDEVKYEKDEEIDVESSEENEELDDTFSSLKDTFIEFDNILNNNNNEEIENNADTEDSVEKQTDDILDLITFDDIEESIISEETQEIKNNPEVIIEKTEAEKAPEEQTNNIIATDKIVVNENRKHNIYTGYDKKIEKIEQGKTDNDTLLISERTGKIYLPYKTSELLDYIHSYPDLYKSLSDVVRQEFILPYNYFSVNPRKSRFSESYNLVRNREGKNIFNASLFAFKMANKRNLNPAIIASCKSRLQLDSYLYCLNNNKLDSFKEFDIEYEVNPV